MGRCLPMDSWASVQSNRVLRPNLAFNNVTLGGMLSADLPALDTQYQFGMYDKIIRFTRPGRMTSHEMPIFKSRNARNKVITTDIFEKHY